MNQLRTNHMDSGLPDAADQVFAVLIDEAARIEQEHGFGKQTPVEDMALFHSEISEATEELRAGRSPDDLYFREDGKPEGVPAELADVVIRIFGFCKRYDVDLVDAILRKMVFNESRPFKHGGKTL